MPVFPLISLDTDDVPQAYHSSFLSETDAREVGNIALLPFNTRFRGPTYPPSDPQAPGTLLSCQILTTRYNRGMPYPLPCKLSLP